MSIRMSDKMRELRNRIDTALNDLSTAVNAENIEEATKLRGEISNLNALYEAAEAEFNARRSIPAAEPDTQSSAEAKCTPAVYNAELFYKAISHRQLTDSERELVLASRSEYNNRFSEGNNENGGYTVPDDLSKEIYSAITSKESVRNLVATEHVKSAHGTRLFRDGEAVKLYNTAEYEEIKEMQNRNYSTLTYNQKKFAGLMAVSSELLADSFVNFKTEIIDWMSDAARNTENFQVLYGPGGENHCQGLLSTANAYKEVSGTTLSIDFLRRVTLTLEAGYRAGAKWVMNSLAFAEVSNIKYEDGRSVIQPDPRNSDGYRLLGYPIVIFDSIKTEEDKTVIAFGDFKRAYKLYDRKTFGISFTDVGAGAWETDSVKAKGIERFDGKIFDRHALIIIRDVSVTPLEATDITSPLSVTITEASLKNMVKADLLDLAAELGVSGVTAESTKQAIVTAIINQFEADEAVSAAE